MEKKKKTNKQARAKIKNEIFVYTLKQKLGPFSP